MKNKKDVSIRDLSATNIKYLAEEYIHHDRNKRIFLKRYLKGLTYDQLAGEEYLSVTSIKNILRQCIDTVIKHIDVRID